MFSLLAPRSGLTNHWANWENARGLALSGASHFNIKTYLCKFFVFLGCSPRGKIVELLDCCGFLRLVYKLRKLKTLALNLF